MILLHQNIDTTKYSTDTKNSPILAISHPNNQSLILCQSSVIAYPLSTGP